MNKSIPEYSEFDKESAELERLLDSPDEAGCLRKYLAYLDKYCAKEYFFLLRNGEAHLLPREPSHITCCPIFWGGKPGACCCANTATPLPCPCWYGRFPKATKP